MRPMIHAAHEAESCLCAPWGEGIAESIKVEM
jgi:hypothetical protein